MAQSKMISFAELIQGRDASVRITDDGMGDIIDTVMLVTGKDCNHANACFRGLKSSLFDNQKVVMHNGRRYAPLRDIIQLVMVLPGKMAKEMRSQFAAIIEKHIEIQKNPATGEPTVHLRADPVEDHETRRKRIKREDQELLDLEQVTQEKRLKNFQTGLALMAQIRPDWMQTDARFRLQIEDMAKNIIGMGAGVTRAMLTNGEEGSKGAASLSISQLAQELGCKRLGHGDMCKAGALAAKRYRAEHDADPPKHRQWVDGAERLVNSYSEADRELLTEVLVEMGLVDE